ncbi:MAG: nucleotide exchange factor GrpE [Synergistales bacterium]|jgi:molecular chaperone GrpE (heat shock protein)|uniref:nucleotide exchange factor GrpE n=1 Tax=Aminivibrio sp. TaxID=1872489 RepID=UPI001E0B7C78|nr:nucleotide exchange factor GrpE [Synergistaceae bacterium]MDD3391278.1 nucleotide exchange factor GrpE [Synergistaceae bacterium]MDD4613444.1 nucleotide exchange factor GrpE [Synergistaceae bacterium]NCC57127.1 nucleotide exchange factor GrpE [Synergistales bacterium]
MTGFFQRKIIGFREAITADIINFFTNETKFFEERLKNIEEQIRLAQRQERQRQLALCTVAESSSAILESLRRMENESLPFKSLLSFAESFLLALQEETESRDYGIIRAKFNALLEAYELASISETLVPFDPERHEACGSTTISGIPDGAVAQIVRPGFLHAGKVLRPAVVVVNRIQVPFEISREEDKNICSNQP